MAVLIFSLFSFFLLALATSPTAQKVPLDQLTTKRRGENGVDVTKATEPPKDEGGCAC